MNTLCPNCGHDQKEDGFPMNCISCAWPQYPPITDLLKMSNVMRLCGYEGFAGGREAIEKAEAKERAEELEDARTEARLDLQAEREDQESHYYSLRDEGRNDDGTGLSYGERNA